LQNVTVELSTARKTEDRKSFRGSSEGNRSGGREKEYDTERKSSVKRIREESA